SMQQVLFRIPLAPGWLPEGVPLAVVLLAVGLVLGGALYLLGRYGRLSSGAKQALCSWGVGLAVAGAALGGGAHLLRRFEVDSIPVYGFGMMLFLAFLACTWLGGRRGEREGISRETIQDIAIWVFVGGLLGARTT